MVLLGFGRGSASPPKRCLCSLLRFILPTIDQIRSDSLTPARLRDVPTLVQQILRRIAYLIHRAKEGNVYCGKKTNCAVVWRHDYLPSEVEWVDMRRAEKASRELDELFSGVSMFVFGSGTTTIEPKAMIEMLDQSSAWLKTLPLHDQRGDLIMTGGKLT